MTTTLQFFAPRFLPEEIEKRPPCTYIPFSEGPRNCIGNRYAVMVIKMAVVEILQNFIVERTVDTQVCMNTLPVYMVTMVISAVSHIRKSRNHSTWPPLQSCFDKYLHAEGT